MIKKIGTAVETLNNYKFLHKSFNRNKQFINTTSIYDHDKLIHRTWDIIESGKRTILKQNYKNEKPIPNSKSSVNIVI